MNIKFYDIDENFIDFLQSIDHQVPDVKYSNRNKFFCGIVLEIDGIKYIAPVSSFKEPQSTNLIIYNKKNEKLSSIRFCFMIPVLDSVIHVKNFKSPENLDRAELLSKELTFCKQNIDKIYKKAKYVYSIGINSNHKLNYTCCNFKKLEAALSKYDPTKIYR